MLVKSSCVFVVVVAAAAAAGAVAHVNCAKARLTYCRGQGFVLHGFLCSLSSCACCCVCMVAMFVVAWPVVSAIVSPLVWVWCLCCVCGIGAHLDCVTRISAPLPFKVSLFQLSVSLIVHFHDCAHCTHCIAFLWAQLYSGSRPWAAYCTRTLLCALWSTWYNSIVINNGDGWKPAKKGGFI